MTKKIFRSTLFVAAVVLLCSVGLVLGVLYDYFDKLQVQQLQDELRIAAAGTELEGVTFLEKLNAGDFRITWVAADGTVLFDTGADASALGNHGDRAEIRQALQFGRGSDTRYSETLMERTVYEAVRLQDGTVLRVSRSEKTMLVLLAGMLHPVMVIVSIAIILSAWLAHRMSKRIVEPLNSLNLEHPLENEAYEEIAPLLRRIHQQHNQIAFQIQALRQKADEFQQITQNMQDGLVLLNCEGVILSLNPAAGRLFGAEKDCVGRHFLTVDRSAQMRDAVNAALDKGHGSAHDSRDGREYRFDLSRIQSDGRTIGVAVLAFDVTESYHAEQTRREFSANVSHELKTPLQSIIGSAELLENGLVQPEDMPRFVGHIHQEAARLVNLVEDIIRLSQLDEGVPLPAEQVDLLALAQETVATLQNAAETKRVTVTVSGESCTVSGVRRLLYEIIYNLCDNAIQYNVPGGSVAVQLQHRGGRVAMQVTDTGIGIAPEHLDRIFERFYRVDKSHSKASGGTGLGLSIVKHAAQYHHARIELESTPGKGTTVTVIF